MSLSVENTGDDGEGNAPATVTGTQNGVAVYFQTLQVSDLSGPGFTKYEFQPFVPDSTGDIYWEATIADDNPDVDVATGITTVKY